MPDNVIAIAICRACTGGSQDVASVASRIAQTLGKNRSRAIASMAERYAQAFSAEAPRERDVLQFVLRDVTWIRYFRSRPGMRKDAKVAVRTWPLDAPTMHPVAAASAWTLPRIETAGALAEWLELTIGELEWFADVKGLLRTSARAAAHHYHYRLVQKRSGGVRLIEAPQERLKTIQRNILSGILEKVPPYYTAAHGFVKGRSVRTFAEPHVGREVVIRLDLQNFFPTIGYARVHALFRTMGYPDEVSTVLSGLCTNVAPGSLFAANRFFPSQLASLVDARALYSRPHLPQGAPTSPLIANLCAYRLDCRLTGLADWAGASYTRYADDIAISGDGAVARNAARYAAQASAIALDEGWSVQHHKTRLMSAAVRQQLAGIVVNRTMNVDRASFDALKAILTNCVRLGPASQNLDARPNYRAYLRGRVAWVTSVNETRGNRLLELFGRIDWNR